MDHGSTIATAALAAALCMATAGAQAFEDSQYPNLKGQWTRVVGPNETAGVIPFAIKVIGRSLVHTIEFEPVVGTSLPKVASEAVIRLRPDVPGID